MNKVFELNPQLDKVYTTSDDECFYNENDAKNHTKSLKDKTVEAVYNEKFLEVVEEENVSDYAKEMAEFNAAEKVKADADAKVKADADAKVKADADAKVKADADAKVKADADAKVKADAKVTKPNTEK